MRKDGEELPPWARAHLAHRAARGICVHGTSDLRTLYQRIEAYRIDAAITEGEPPISTEEAIFGPIPNNAVLRARRRALIDEALPREVAERTSCAQRVPGPGHRKRAVSA